MTYPRMGERLNPPFNRRSLKFALLKHMSTRKASLEEHIIHALGGYSTTGVQHSLGELVNMGLVERETVTEPSNWSRDHLIEWHYYGLTIKGLRFYQERLEREREP